MSYDKSKRDVCQASTPIENFVCSFIVKIGIKTLPAFSILVGEATMSYILGHVIILPSPTGGTIRGVSCKDDVRALKK